MTVLYFKECTKQNYGSNNLVTGGSLQLPPSSLFPQERHPQLGLIE